MSNFDVTKYPAGPIPKIIEALHRVNIRCPVSEPKVLEVFGGTGQAHIMAYMQFFPKNLHIWEIDANKVSELMTNVPRANVRCLDSFKEVQRTDFRQNFKGFDIIIIDPVLFGGDNCEYFDLFPHIFNFCARPAWFVITVCPDPSKLWDQAESVYLKKMDRWEVQKMIFAWNTAREKFYHLQQYDYDSIVPSGLDDEPIAPPRSNVSLDCIGDTHGKLALDNRYRSNFISFIQRDVALWYMVHEVEKMADSEMIATGGR